MYRTGSWKDMLSVDFSAEAKKKEETKQMLLRHICRLRTQNHYTEKENFTMKQPAKRHIKRSTAIALAACLTVALSISAFALGGYFRLGPFAQYNFTPGTAENGASPGTAQAPDTADGSGDTGDLDKTSTYFSDPDDAQPYLAFSALSFSYVPSDYVPDGCRIYNGDNGLPEQNAKYLQMNYGKSDGSGDYIFVQARLMDEETAFTYDSDTDGDASQTTINGHDALVYDNSVSVLMDDVLYTLSAKNLPQSELILMAESLG